MSRILKVSGSDYRLQVQGGGNIILDTGSQIGTVTVTGNLDVMGTQTNIASTSSTLVDNIIQLNYNSDSGQLYTGIGLPLSAPIYGQSGIEMWRGSLNAAQFVFSEQVYHYDPTQTNTILGDAYNSTHNIKGTFQLKTRLPSSSNPATGTYLDGLQLRTIVNDSTQDLFFDMQGGTFALGIVNSTNYESRIGNENGGNNDQIPNIQYVKSYVSASGGVANVSLIHYPLTGSYNTVAQTTNNSIDFLVGAQLKAQVTAGGLNINDVLLAGDTITNVSVNPLVLTATNNTVEVNAVLNLDNQSTDITTPKTTLVGGLPTTTIYTKSAEGPGRTGIYFTNSKAYGSNAYNNDELVSKNRAVLLSILL